MVTLKLVLPLLRRKDWFAVIDLKDWFTVIDLFFMSPFILLTGSTYASNLELRPTNSKDFHSDSQQLPEYSPNAWLLYQLTSKFTKFTSPHSSMTGCS